MTKRITEQSRGLSVFWLKKNGFLHRDYSQQNGNITWSYCGEARSSIEFSVKRDNWGTTYEATYIQLNYTYTNHWTEQKECMDYNIQLSTTPCYYGGKRYWFICPLYKNNVYCGRRVGVIYSIGKWFGCRHCGDIVYAAQMESGKYRWGGPTIPDIEKAEKEVKRYYYNGKPTRKYRRLMRMNDRFENGFLMVAAQLSPQFRGFADLKK